MSQLWIDEFPEDLSGRSFAEVVAEASAVLGQPVSIGEGPFVRWPGATKWVAISRSYTGGAILEVEDAATAADEEYRTFKWAEPNDLPYKWRADDFARMPKDTLYPGEIPIESIDELRTKIPALITSLIEATKSSATGARSATMLIWFEDPATAHLARMDRINARQRASFAVSESKEGDTKVTIRANSLGRVPKVLTAEPEDLVAAADIVVSEIQSWNVAGPHELRCDGFLDRVAKPGVRWRGSFIDFGLMAQSWQA